MVFLSCLLFPTVAQYDPYTKEIKTIIIRLPENKDKNVKLKDLNVYNKITAIAKQEGFKNIELLHQIAYYESIRSCPNNPDRCINDKNNNPTTSKDRGLFQYNSYWRSDVKDDCAYNIECSTIQAIKDIRAGGRLETKWYAVKNIDKKLLTKLY